MSTVVRGHFRRNKAGEQIWIRQYVRGTSKDSSIVAPLTRSPLSSTIRFSRRTSNLDALLSIADSGNIGRAIVNAIASNMISELNVQAGKFSNTGKLANSFYVTWIGDSDAEIVSDLPYAKTWIDNSNQGSPSAQSIRSWMVRIDSFSSSSARELRSISWAIRQSMETGSGEGSTGNSVLRSLDPVGERYFDYVSEAMRQVEPFVYSIGASFNNI